MVEVSLFENFHYKVFGHVELLLPLFCSIHKRIKVPLKAMQLLELFISLMTKPVITEDLHLWENPGQDWISAKYLNLDLDSVMACDDTMTADAHLAASQFCCSPCPLNLVILGGSQMILFCDFQFQLCFSYWVDIFIAGYLKVWMTFREIL